MPFKNKTILITGGTGSLGTRLTEIILKEYSPKTIRIFSRGELKQSQMQTKFNDRRLRFFIGDVRDKRRLYRATNGVDIVIHCAALKQVPICEYNVDEAIENNIIGTMNVTNVAIDNKIEKVMLASTDKACVDGYARVKLDKKKIILLKDIVKNKKEINTCSFDENKGTIESKKIIGWYENKRALRNMIHLSHEHSRFTRGDRAGVWVTEDHKILTKNGWKSADQITDNDYLMIDKPYPNEKQYSFLVGTLMGDAGIYRSGKNGNYYFNIGQINKEWVQIKIDALRGLPHSKISKNIHEKYKPFYHVYYSCLPIWKELREKFYPDKIKQVPREEVIRALDFHPDIFFTAWYLDDGVRVKKDNYRHGETIKIATDGFTEEDVTWLATILTERGYPCSAIRQLKEKKAYWILCFGRMATKRIFKLIERAVPSSMSYKISHGVYDCNFWNLGQSNQSSFSKAIILGSKHSKKYCPGKVYCLDVKDTHNFIVNDIILHNCHPVNTYGATKLVAEKLFTQSNVYAGGRGTIFSCVRYGNVIGSRGSVIPIFQKQRKAGKITITDETMTRFWITQEQAVHFIIDCIGKMRGGEIFIPKIPSMKIIDLAKTIAPDCKIEVVGIRPGEKIHEVLLTIEEARHAKEFVNYFMIEPEFKFWNRNNLGGEILPDSFKYSSNENHLWLTKKELKKILEDIK